MIHPSFDSMFEISLCSLDGGKVRVVMRDQTVMISDNHTLSHHPRQFRNITSFTENPKSFNQSNPETTPCHSPHLPIFVYQIIIFCAISQGNIETSPLSPPNNQRQAKSQPLQLGWSLLLGPFASGRVWKGEVAQKKESHFSGAFPQERKASKVQG